MLAAERCDNRSANEILQPGKFHRRCWKICTIRRRIRVSRHYGIGLRKCGLGHRGGCPGGLQRHCVCLRADRLWEIVYHARLHRACPGALVRSDLDRQFRDKVRQISGDSPLPDPGFYVELCRYAYPKH